MKCRHQLVDLSAFTCGGDQVLLPETAANQSARPPVAPSFEEAMAAVGGWPSSQPQSMSEVRMVAGLTWTTC